MQNNKGDQSLDCSKSDAVDPVEIIGQLIEDNPDLDEQELAKEIEISFSRSRFSGPLPPPEVLQQYKDIYPNAPELIFKNFSQQAEHRQSLEKVGLNGAISRDKRSQWMAYSLCIFVVLAAIYCASNGYGALSLALVTGAFATFLSGFLGSSKKESKESAAKE